MANLYFPQLTSGALAQYPIKKTRLVRTIKNVLPDGSMVLLADPGGARLLWQMAYTSLSTVDVGALQAHFEACVGPYHAFTFIDPTDNMLVSSFDLTATGWQTSSLIQLSAGMADPDGGTCCIHSDEHEPSESRDQPKPERPGQLSILFFALCR